MVPAALPRQEVGHDGGLDELVTEFQRRLASAPRAAAHGDWRPRSGPSARNARRLAGPTASTRHGDGCGPLDLPENSVLQRLIDAGVESGGAVARPGSAVVLAQLVIGSPDLGDLLPRQRPTRRRHQPKGSATRRRTTPEASDHDPAQAASQRAAGQFASRAQELFGNERVAL